MRILLFILFLLHFQFAFAQSELPEGFGDYRTIPKEMIEIGKVYAMSFQPPEFQEFIWKDSVLLLEQNQHLLNGLKLGEDYTIQTEIVLVKPEYINWIFEEPEFEKAVDYIVFDTIYYEKDKWFYPQPLQIIPKQKYLKRNMLGEPNENLILWGFYELYPKEYQKIIGKHKVELIREILESTPKIMAYKVTKHHYKTQIDTFRTIHLLNDFSNDSLQFSSISVFRMTEAGTFFNLWREVYCPHCFHSSLSIDMFLRIQKVLTSKGYDVPLNNEFDEQTKAALLQFQENNNLEQGQLSKETWKALGLQSVYFD